MEFRVLGPIEAQDGDRLVALGPRMPKALVAVLLLEPGRVVSLDRLIDLLWGDEPPAAATAALQVYVSGLRRVLEPDRPARTPPSVLVTQPPGYVLRVDPHDIDAVRFEALAAAGRESLAAGDAGTAQDRLRSALGLWRGTAYAELAFESFLQVEIARLHELRASAWEALMEAELARGRHALVIADLERLAAEEPIRERRWELLALALYRDGRQAEALRTLQRARQVLGEQLGIDPGPALRRLEDGILQQSPALEVQPVAVAAVPSAEEAKPAPVPAGGRPLVGRDAEVAQLGAALDAAASGRGRVVLIAGEPGIGKTRLAEELSSLASTRGAVVAWGRCHEGDASPAYWPWVQVIRTLAHQADPAAVRRALVVGAEELAQIVPDIKEVAGRPLEPLVLLQPEAARTRLYDAVVDLVLRLAGESPLSLVIDDLHWADAPSLELLCLLAARLPEASILLACTFRDFEGDLSAGVRGALGALARVPDIVRIRPGGLSEDDVGQLVADATGGDAGPEVTSAIRDRTEGNPFFVSELVRLLQSERQLDHATGVVRDSIPSGVRDVIRLRLARLPDETVALLRLAAVAGRDFDLDVVAAAAGVDEDTALERVEASLLIGLVVEQADVLGRYRFSHSLVRETLYQELSAARRARSHRALGEALARAGDDSHTLDVARHLYAAAPLGGREIAYEWVLRAADRARGLLAFEQVEEQLARALELVEAMPPGPETSRRELAARTRMGMSLMMTRGYSAPEVGEAWSRAALVCRETDDAPEVLTATWGMWSYACVRADFARALAIAEECLGRGDRSGALAFQLLGHHTLTVTLWHLGRLGEAAEHCRLLGDLCSRASDEVIGQLVDRDPRCGRLVFGGMVLALGGRTEEAAASLDEALRASRTNGRPFTIALTHVVACLGRAICDDRGAARRDASDAAALAHRHGFRQLAAMAAIVQGWADSDAAGVRAGLADFEAAGSRMLLHFFYGLLAQVEHDAGRRAEARAGVERALAESESTGERFWAAELHRIRAELLLPGPADRVTEARKEFDRALSVAREQGAGLLEARAADSARRRLGPESVGTRPSPASA